MTVRLWFRPTAYATLAISLVSTSVLSGVVSQSSGAAPFAARASVAPNIQYLGDFLPGTAFTVTVENTSTEDSIGAVEVDRPGKAWTIVGCPSAPAGWSAQRSDTMCRYRSSTSTADDIAPGASAEFRVAATTPPGTQNLAGTWSVQVSKSSTFDKPSKLVAAAAIPPGLGITAYSFQVLDVVVDPVTTTPGAACPAPAKSATAGSTGHTFVVCGRNRTTGTLTPTAAQSSLAGTFVADPGSFTSGPVEPSSASRVLGSWTDVTIIGSPGTSKTVLAKIGSASNRTSPVTTLTGYEATAPANVAPEANDDADTFSEDNTGTTVNVLANDTDANGDSLAVTAVDTTGTDGQVTNNGTDLTYDPNGAFESLGDGETATDSFSYTVSDGNGGTDTATVTITITGANDPPVAVDDADTVSESSTGTIVDVLGNDTDADADTLAVSAVDTTGTTGQVTNNGTDVTYDPNSAFDSLNTGETATDTFTYTVSDGNGGTDTATVTITITGISGANTPPSATDDIDTVGEDSTGSTVDVLGNDTDADLDTLAVTAVDTTGTSGLVTNNGTDVTYDPNGAFDLLSAGDTASDTFTYTVSDGNGGTDTATVTITITGVNDAPVIAGPEIEVLSYTENDLATAITNAGTVSDADSANFDTGTLTVDYSAGGQAEDRLEIRNQGTGAGQIGVSGSNVTYGGVTIGTFAGGTGTTPLVITLNTSATAAAAQALLRNITYRNVSDDPSTATRTARFVLTDGDGGISAPATRQITVTAVNDAPNAVDDTDTVSESSTGTIIDVRANDTDLDGDTLAVTGVDTTGTTGLVTNNGTDVTYDPNGAFDSLNTGETATDTFTYTISDGNGGTDVATVTITITGVGGANSPPVAVDDADTVSEDSTGSAIDLLGNDTDADLDTLAVTAVDTTGTDGLVTNNGTDVTYDPNGAFESLGAGQTDTDTFSYTVSDGNGGTDTATVTITITGVNDAPVVAGIEGSPLAYAENDPATPITATGTVTDVDSANFDTGTLTVDYSSGGQAEDRLEIRNQGTSAGQIGVSGSNVTYGGVTIGTFTGGTGTTPLVITLNTSATAAATQALLRNITYRNVSATPSTALRTVRFVLTDGDGGTSAPDTRQIAVAPSVNAPVVTTTAGSTSYTEGAPATVVDAGLTATDADSANLVSATVQITGNYANGQDVLSVTPPGGIAANFDAGTGMLTLTGTASVATYQTALRAVRYQNLSDTPSILARTVTFKVNDGDVESLAATKGIAVTAANDAPAIAAVEGAALAYVENDPATVITATGTVTDVDSANFATGTLTVDYSAGGQAEDRLAIRNQGTGAGQIGVSGGTLTYGGVTIGAFTGGTGTAPLVITLNASATPAAAQALLRNTTYRNVSENPSTATRTARFVLTDGDGGTSAPATRQITVAAANDAPVVTTTAGSLAHTEGEPAEVIDAAVTAIDVDSTNLTGATVQVTGNYANGQDVLAVTNQLGITGNFDAGTGTLTLTGTTTVANYQTVLRTVTYRNTSDSPSTLARTVTFTVTDGSATSNAATRGIAVTAADDAPVLTASGGSTPYTEQAVPVGVDPTLSATDQDGGANVTGATVTITSPVAGDTLHFSTQNGITGIFSAGVLTLSGSATLAQYETALRTVQFSNPTSDAPGASRQIGFRITTPVLSNSSNKTVAITQVNDAPAVSLDVAGPLAYAEQAGFVNLFGPAATIVDPDSTTLSSLAVTTTAGFDAAFDTVRLNPAVAGFTAGFTGGVLTLTRAGGTVAEYQNALRNVQFGNTDNDPDNRNDGTPDAADAGRDFSVVANDGGAGGTSAPQTRAASITPVNDAPSAPSVLPTAAGIRNTTLVAGTTTPEPSVTRTVNFIGNSTDPDSLESSIAVLAVTSQASTQNGRITLATDGDLRYEPPASGTLASDTYGYALTDGITASTPITFTVNLSGAVWYVADQAPLPQDGTAARPFDTVAAAVAAAPAGQAVHIRRAPGDGVLTGSVVLGTNDKLLGEGVALTNTDVGSATPETLFPAGTKPVLTAVGADVVTLASGVQVAGLSVNPDGAANGLFGNATAGVILRSMDLTDTGVASTQPGIELTGAGNGLTFTAPVTLSTTQAGALNVAGAALAGTVASTSVSGSTNSAGVSLTNTTGSLTFTTVAITTSGQPGFVLNNADAIDVGGGTVAATSRAAVDATLLDAGSDLTFTDVDSTSSTGDGVNLDGADANWTFSAGVGSTISGAAGIGFDVNNGTGAVTYAGGIASTTGKAVDVSSRAGNATFSGNLTGTGTGIVVTGNSAGTTTFSGTTKTLSTGAANAVDLTGNTGATVAFSGGGLGITTTSGVGFNATGGGTVTVAGAVNTISTTTGTGLNVSATTIGAANMTFQSIASNGAPSGIVLNGTGSAGTFNVTGTAAADSGGIIANTTGPGVSLTNADAISLNRIKLQGTDRSGIQGTGVTGFSLTNSTITNAGDSHVDDDDSSIAFNDTSSETNNNVDGAVTITGNTLTNAFGAGIEIFQFAGTISDAVITGNTISSSFDPAQSKRSGIALNLFGSTTTVASLTKGNISNNTVTGFPSGDGISLQGANTASATAPAGTYGTPGSATNIVTFTGNQVIGDTTNKINGFGIAASVTGRGQGNFSITNNGTAGSPIRNTLSSPIAIGLAGDATAYFVVTGNQISANNQFSSAGIALGTDKNIQADLSTLTHPVARATISNNTIANTSGSGIRVLHRSSNGTVNLRVESNTITNVVNPGPGIRVENGSSADAAYNPTMCASISGNNVQSGPADGFGDKNPGINLYKSSALSTTYVFGLTGLVPSPASNAQVETYVTGLNPLSATGAGFFAGKKVAVRTGSNYTSCVLPAGM